MANTAKTITVAMTGASGSLYALRLLECLLAENVTVHLIVSDAAKIVLATEAGFPELDSHLALEKEMGQRFGNDNLYVHAVRDWFAPPASGSAMIEAMVVCPCSMGTLSAIAHGASNSLLERAADVILKEKRKLILVPREAPFSTIHLENMLKLSQYGAVIIPANPGFYYEPTTIEDLVDFVVARILDQLDVSHTLCQRWGS